MTISLEPGEPNLYAGSDENLFDQKKQPDAGGGDPEEDDFEDPDRPRSNMGAVFDPNEEPKQAKQVKPDQGKAKPGKKKRQRKVKDLMAGEPE